MYIDIGDSMVAGMMVITFLSACGTCYLAGLSLLNSIALKEAKKLLEKKASDFDKLAKLSSESSVSCVEKVKQLSDRIESMESMYSFMVANNTPSGTWKK